jgi:hypothetical protein
MHCRESLINSGALKICENLGLLQRFVRGSVPSRALAKLVGLCAQTSLVFQWLLKFSTFSNARIESAPERSNSVEFCDIFYRYLAAMNSMSSSIKKNLERQSLKKALLEAIAVKAFWSYDPDQVSSNIDDEKLIERVLVYGSDNDRAKLQDIFPLKEIQKVWEEKLVIQEPRLHDLNRKLAASFFHIVGVENHIQRAYAKHNLYDQFR